MEPIGKRWRNVVRFFLCMLQKPPFYRTKLMLDLQLFIERHKIAGKTLNGLLNKSSVTLPSRDSNMSFDNPCDVQFSCTSNTIEHRNTNKRKPRQSRDHHEPCRCSMAAIPEAFSMLKAEPAVSAKDFLVQMVKEESDLADERIHFEQIVEEEGDPTDGQIDTDAENFIREFYNKLRLQEQLAASPGLEN